MFVKCLVTINIIDIIRYVIVVVKIMLQTKYDKIAFNKIGKEE